ncbi:MAG: glycosyl transferase family 1 [Candidatus Binatia bacterium]|nr:MAG: glycosyl transferase family 1 [Candidatus Binatia bacterium]
MSKEPLRICLLSYRGNPRSGGQGIYLRHLSRALASLGHEVHVWSGQPYPELDDGVHFDPLPSLDLWNEEAFFRIPRPSELTDPINVFEWLATITGGFPEPRTFCWRALRRYRRLPPEGRFDVVHDNQSLGTGLLELRKLVPVVATIHHPITVDYRLGLRAERSWKKRWGLRRWYTFIPMQKRVARVLDRIVTVSETSARDIAREFGLRPERLRVVPCGVDLDLFRPLPGIPRRGDRIITTVSHDAPLKGMAFLLEAFAELLRERPGLSLTVIGGRNGDSPTAKKVRELGLDGSVRLTGRVATEEIVRLYAESTVAVVPSLYEGFGLPAAEAMACEVPVVSSDAGALPEVVGRDGSSALLVPPGDPRSLKEAISALLDAPERRAEMGAAGRKRVETLFSWRRAAELCVEIYREAIEERRALGC